MSSPDEANKAGQGGPPPETLDTEPGGQPAGQETQPEQAPESQPTEPVNPHGPTAASKEPTVDALQEQLADLKDKLLRVAAENENVRKRAERDKLEASKFGISKFARDLMSVADNFQRALQSVTDEMRQEGGSVVGNLIAGIEMTNHELHQAFEKNGIVRLDPRPGEKFDPNFHQAVAEVPAPGQPNGTVVQVTQTGYLIEDRLLRPAMVFVARNAKDAASPTPEEPAQGEEPGGSSDPGSKVNTTA